MSDGDDLVIEINMTLSGQLAKTLVRESARRKREPVEVLADLVLVACRDNLFAAVLDDDEGEIA